MTVAKNRADRVMLYDISWQQFENLLKDLGEHRAARLAYDRTTLEIIIPLPENIIKKSLALRFKTSLKSWLLQIKILTLFRFLILTYSIQNLKSFD
ncbi:MAG: hypothetical protein V7L04_24410 [Nostoc sp.]|uniref:hypothetical protein n=1 Tax=Nostoc sp. TaxID=1180 RepID=UPI002FF9C915